MRSIPAQPWPRVGLFVLLLVLAGVAVWEWNARRLGYTPSYADTAGLWAIERRKVEALEDPVVAVGASRTFFDLDLAAWEELTGRPIIQLSIVGTSPRRFLTDLADDPKFRGLAIVGVEPDLFVREGGFRAHFLDDARKQSPSDRLSQRLAMALERRLAFLNKDDLPLFALLRHIKLRNRKDAGDPYLEVWNLNNIYQHRQSYMWDRIERDPWLLEHATMAWEDGMDETPIVADSLVGAMIAANKRDVARIRGRGGEVVYVQWPATDKYLSFENRTVPRERVWDPLLRETGAIGIHFEDHPSLQGYDLPEWSHLAARETPRFTRALVPLIQQALCAQHSPWAYRIGTPTGNCEVTESAPS